jgi:hypothetical protein
MSLLPYKDDDGHAPPLSVFGKTFNLTFISGVLLLEPQKARRFLLFTD